MLALGLPPGCVVALGAREVALFVLALEAVLVWISLKDLVTRRRETVTEDTLNGTLTYATDDEEKVFPGRVWWSVFGALTAVVSAD